MPAFVYVDVPLPTQAINQTQAPIRTNFQSLQSLINVNHVDFADPNNAGKHFFIQMPAAVPVTVTVPGEIGLYSRNGTVSGQPELFFQRQNLGANLGIPMTESVTANPGWTYLPSGIKIVWGTGTTAGATRVITYTATAGFPGFSTFALPFVTRQRTGVAGSTTNFIYVLDTYNNLQFTAVSADSANNTDFIWAAIGF